MLIDLIILVIRLATKNSNSSNSSPTKRKVNAGHVTIECPFCQTLGIATQFNLDQRTGNAWQRVMDVYECSHCRRSMNAEAMRNDGTGVLIAKTWECPACQALNPAVRFDCVSCGSPIR
jgi:hypothetical protein